MRYDAQKTYDIEKSKEYLNKLIKDKVCYELKKIVKKRSTIQNAYLHVLISIWGNHHGLLLEEAKKVIKEEIGYTYEKKGRTFLMLTRNMNSKELTVFIDKFRDWSVKVCDYYLPTSLEYFEDQMRFDNEIDIYKNLDYTQKQ